MIKKNCYFYYEYQGRFPISNMGCTYSLSLEDKKLWDLQDGDCDDCPYYITTAEANKIVRKSIKNRNKM